MLLVIALMIHSAKWMRETSTTSAAGWVSGGVLAWASGDAHLASTLRGPSDFTIRVPARREMPSIVEAARAPNPCSPFSGSNTPEHNMKNI